MDEIDFDIAFQALTQNAPFPWQRALYQRFTSNEFPDSCNLPTGLGKTAVIPIWLIALANAPQVVPRRLVYVVNRRTVVDQSTREAEKVRANLANVPRLREALNELCAVPTKVPLAISTLRGQFADNREWSADPARPAVIAGTVDMIGSRLLFSGYGCGFRSRPLHAGFLGQDALVVHDEAHLEPAFQRLLVAIREEQGRCGDFRPLRVMELTATSRGDVVPFTLTDADRADDTVMQRIKAAKFLQLHKVDDEKKSLVDAVVKKAMEYKGSGEAILIFLRSVKDAEEVAKKLPQKQAAQLTGTLRGRERDRLATSNGVFARFLPEGDRRCEIVGGTVYLVCTSAGEVGVNLSADHLVCDLTPFDSMAQRFGRVNRFGGVNRFGLQKESCVAVFHPARFGEDEYESRRSLTLKLLRDLKGNASPDAIGDLDPVERQAAFSPAPTVLEPSDILFDAWALTSACKALTGSPDLPGRPPVAAYLHGLVDLDPPQTQVAWRSEVEILTEDILNSVAPEEPLEVYPLKPHELLRDRTDRVRKHLGQIAERLPDVVAWLVSDDGTVRVDRLAALIEKDRDSDPLNGKTILLPPSAGGLQDGMLNGSVETTAELLPELDVADKWFDDEAGTRPRRKRCWDEEPAPAGMRLVCVIDTHPESEGEEELARRFWRWFVRPRSADDEGSKYATERQTLDAHQKSAESFGFELANKLGLSECERKAVTFASRHHDDGKARGLWQSSIGNMGGEPLAKSGKKGGMEILTRYRHEFGSIMDVIATVEFAELPDEVKDLALHLIAAHHGRGRPFFPIRESFDPESKVGDEVELSEEVPRRYARLQRKYGRWRLAYLESLVRAADALASQPTKEDAHAQP